MAAYGSGEQALEAGRSRVAGRGLALMRVSTTFRPFDEFDFHDLLSWRFPAHHIEANDGTCFFEGLHCS